MSDMKTILVRYYNPSEVMDVTPETTADEIKEYCFRVNKYTSEGAALNAYAETPCTWSTLLDETADVKKFVDEAYEHIKQHDMEWLEENFT